MNVKSLLRCCLSMVALSAACAQNAQPPGGAAAGVGGTTGLGGSGSTGAAGSTATGAAGSTSTGAAGSTTTGAGGAATGGAGGTATTGPDGGVGGAGGSSGGTGGGVAAVFSRPKLILPNQPYPTTMINVPRASWAMDLVSPTMNNKHHHNQPMVLNGYLILNGNEEFFVWDITDPAHPRQVSQFLTPNRCATCGGKGEGEAESHTVSYARYGDKFYSVTTSGRGVDIWNLTDLTQPIHVKSIALEGVNYGDFTAAVWGLFWEGDTIYVGATDTGLHILDATNPENVTFVKRLPTSMLGTVSAGPLDAVGNILVITTPKETAGIATMDISDPLNPVLLDSIRPSAKSYIGQFYRHYVFLQSPVRAWDVLTNPTSIGGAATPLGSLTTAASEYMSFSDGFMFLGHLRPDAGATKIDLTDLTKMTITDRIWGRLNLGGINDDQFTLSIGNLLVMGDDQEPYAGSVIGVHATAPDSKPPVVDTVIPRDKATVSVKSRVGISFTDNIELATVNGASFIVRPVGGETLPGKWGSRMGVLTFDPDQDLQPKTTYEVVLPKGGITDLVGNALAQDFKSTFTTQ